MLFQIFEQKRENISRFLIYEWLTDADTIAYQSFIVCPYSSPQGGRQEQKEKAVGSVNDLLSDEDMKDLSYEGISPS